ncbi:MAG: Rieske 2Fe-2S domain-containing protein [Candidatus Tectomicrobia bacterium]|nr:Rieske 2Fe-2S domain-containing protein [Candidatus Tectomicrobia bacterium]
MLSREENELLTRVGPDMPMGQTMRRYWMPALMARELPVPDCAPVRVRLLGEDLVAFRDTEGRLGLLDELCPHRRVSLYFGRNEECGLRCVYHGWKFDVEGQCVDMMNEPAELDFKNKIRTTSYPTVEAGGIIWAYMGPAELRPPDPKFAWTQVPESHRQVSKVIQECNWLQALEGGIDTSHAPILHRSISSTATQPGIDPNSAWVRSGAPRLELDVTNYGYRYAGVRQLGEAEKHIRAYQFVLPFHQLRPSATEDGHDAVAGHIWVPMDDGNCMVYNWTYTLGEAPLTDEDRLERRLGNGPHDVDPRTFRSYDNRENDYGMDRQAQKDETFTGIQGVNKQDRAIQESMGRIVDRSREHLGPADRAIIQARRLLLQAIKTVQEGGIPRGIEPDYYPIKAGQGLVPADMDWRQLLESDLSTAQTS